MSVKSAIAYITRIREDKDFLRAVKAAIGEEGGLALIRAHGYDFTLEEFKEATDEIYREFGIAPL